MLPRRAFAVLRALIIAPLFISLWTFFVPRWIAGPHAFDNPNPFGWIVVAVGALIAVPCAWEFAWRGLGTPAPFDPPRRLVITGPYRFVRNPMYVGMGLALIGEGIVYPNIRLLMWIMVAVLWLLLNGFIIIYEEPTLRRMFDGDYEKYCRDVRRWIPRLRPFDNPSGAALE
jgi:protein-S-isoprenylcysteine O-methyltransferase Ste14